MTDLDPIAAAVEPVVGALGLDLYDLEIGGGPRASLRVTVHRPGGVDLDTIAAASDAVSRALDADPAVQAAWRGPYTLEVSSPGLERRLRTPAHFRGAIGSPVSIKTGREHGGLRRRGVIVAADDDAVDVEFDAGRERLAYADVAQARTIFEWGAGAKPGKRAAREVATR